MGRTPIWTDIEASLRGDIANGRYAPGEKLPTEAALAKRFDVNRHTVRRALAALQEAGLTHSRRGAGVFVLAKPTDFRIGRRTRLSENAAREGRAATREILRLETAPADAREAEALEIEAGAPVHIWEGVALIDGAPIAVFHSTFPAERLPGMAEALAAELSVTKALARIGVKDYTRASTELTATAARPSQALRLKVAEGAPLLRSVSVNVGPDGAPVEYGRTWFAGDRVRLMVDDL